MLIRTIRKGLEAFEYKFETFERDLKHSNPNSNLSKRIPNIRSIQSTRKDSNTNSNHSNEIRSFRMRMLTVWKAFEAFECKFEAFERDSKHSNVNSKHSKGIRSIRMEILPIWTKFEAFECLFEAFYQIVTIRNGFEALEAFERDSNANSNHFNQFRSIWMQIRKIRKGHEAFINKFEPFKKDSNAKSNYSKWIWSIGSIQKGFECKLTIRSKFEAFECKF